ncbi:MAG: hypothetical protein ACYTEX_09660 [Planctomycetota bacterium]|jgi:hypothetical protein
MEELKTSRLAKGAMICGLLNLCLIPLIWLIYPYRSSSGWVFDLLGLFFLAFLGSLLLGPSLGVAALVVIKENEPGLKGRVFAATGFVPLLLAAGIYVVLQIDLARQRRLFDETKQKLLAVEIGMTRDQVSDTLGDSLSVSVGQCAFRGRHLETWYFPELWVGVSEVTNCTFDRDTGQVIEVTILGKTEKIDEPFRALRYGQFWRFERICSLPKLEYTVGDTIELNFEIRSTEPDYICLYANRAKSLWLWVRSATEDKAMTHGQGYCVPAETTEEDEIDTIKIGPGKPFRMTVKGQVAESAQTEGIVFDFGAFGRFDKDDVGEFSIGGYWIPIRPAFFDPSEDYTNNAYIEVKRRQGGSGQDTSS